MLYSPFDRQDAEEIWSPAPVMLRSMTIHAAQQNYRIRGIDIANRAGRCKAVDRVRL